MVLLATASINIVHLESRLAQEDTSPPGPMFIGEADQILNLDPLPAIIYSPAGVAPEHLVDFADDEAQIGLRQAFKDPLIYANPH